MHSFEPPRGALFHNPGDAEIAAIGAVGEVMRIVGGELDVANEAETLNLDVAMDAIAFIKPSVPPEAQRLLDGASNLGSKCTALARVKLLQMRNDPTSSSDTVN